MRVSDYAERTGFVRAVVRKIFHERGRGAPMMEVQVRHPFQHRRVNQVLVAPEGAYSGQFLFFGKKAQLAIGNIVPVGNLPEGTVICNIEAKPGDRGKLARASGDYGIVVGHNTETGRSRVKLPSGQKKTLQSNCRAMIGLVSGGGRIEKPLLKAGNAYYRWKNRPKNWPQVRGVARNPVEHKHGGGGHQHIGHPSTVRRTSCPGQKVGLIAARRTGRIRGGQKGGAAEN
jgi:large subunit ribosomal protein L8e